MSNVEKALKQKLEPGQSQRVMKIGIATQEYIWSINDLVPECDARKELLEKVNDLESSLIEVIAKNGKTGDEKGEIPLMGTAEALMAAKMKEVNDEKPEAESKPKKPTVKKKKTKKP